MKSDEFEYMKKMISSLSYRQTIDLKRRLEAHINKELKTSLPLSNEELLLLSELFKGELVKK